MHKDKRTIRGEEREWLLYEKGPYEWLTFHDVLDQVKNLARGMIALGVKPVRSPRPTSSASGQPDRCCSQKDSVCIFLDTCREWQLMAHACFHGNLQLATIYASLGKGGLLHALSQTKSCALLADASLFKTVPFAVLPPLPLQKLIIRHFRSLKRWRASMVSVTFFMWVTRMKRTKKHWSKH